MMKQENLGKHGETTTGSRQHEYKGGLEGEGTSDGIQGSGAGVAEAWRELVITKIDALKEMGEVRYKGLNQRLTDHLTTRTPGLAFYITIAMAIVTALLVAIPFILNGNDAQAIKEFDGRIQKIEYLIEDLKPHIEPLLQQRDSQYIDAANSEDLNTDKAQ
jgi:hypothetical protein